jgi:hypothetical protein
MVVWGLTLGAVVLVVTVVQVAAYYYLVGDAAGPTAGDDPGRRTAPDGEGRGSGERTTERADGRDRRRCPDCGVPNDGAVVYTYCRDCGATLS